MSGRRFRVGYTEAGGAMLLDGTREVMTGPAEELEAMAAALNATPPETLDELRAAVMDLIMQTRNCSFGPGPALKGQP